MIEIAIIFLIGKIILKLYKTNADNNAMIRGKIDSRSEDNLTYVDGNAKIRLLSNNHLCIYETLPNGCRVLRDIQTNDIIKNYTQEQNQKDYYNSYQKAIKSGNKIFCYDFNTHEKDKIKGMRYLNINTGEKYVIRNFNAIPFYVNIETGKILGVVDKTKIHSQNVEKIIKSYSHLQRIEKQKSFQDVGKYFFNAYWHIADDCCYCGKY